MISDRCKRAIRLLSTYAVITLLAWFVTMISDLSLFTSLDVLDDRPPVAHTHTSMPLIWLNNIVKFPVFTTVDWALKFPLGQRLFWGSSHVVDTMWIVCYLLHGLWWTSVLWLCRRVALLRSSRKGHSPSR